MLMMLRNCLITFVSLALLSAGVLAEIHWDVQSVDENGVGNHSKVGANPLDPNNKVVLEGIVLNNPEDMVDPSYDAPGEIGGQWQIFVQGEGTDHAGTALWMGQKYSNMYGGGDDYKENDWNNEIQRLNYNGTTHLLRAGDRVRVTGFIACFGGKTNVNERHNSIAGMDFTVEWLGESPGLATPETITLSDVMNIDDGDPSTHEDIFDQTRQTGGEYYQGTFVRINNLTLTDSQGWGMENWPDRKCTVTDGTGRYFTLRMPRASQVNLGDAPTGEFDVIGIFNQESESPNGTYGYELYVSEVIVPEPMTMAILLTGLPFALTRRKK